MASSTAPLVLLTGATGFVGYLTLLELLRAGYRVRTVVRSPSAEPKINTTASIKALVPSPEALSFVVVPDMALPGAFDKHVQDASYIVHVASPVPSFGAGVPQPPEQYETYFVKNAVANHINVLESAAKANKAGTAKVKRVVLTSSCMAIMPFEYYTGAPSIDYTVVFGPDSRTPDAQGELTNEVQAYAAGKVAALNAVDKWIAEHSGGDGECENKVAFDVVNVIPGFIFGRDEMTGSTAGMQAGSTNAILLGLLRGTKGEWPYNGNSVLGSDVAKVHVLALDARVVAPGNHSFNASRSIVWNDAIDVLRRKFTVEVEAGHFSLEGTQPTLPIKMDASKTEEVFGFKLASYEEQIEQVARQYLELLAKEA